jgi:hypothetical protein
MESNPTAAPANNPDVTRACVNRIVDPFRAIRLFEKESALVREPLPRPDIDSNRSSKWTNVFQQKRWWFIAGVERA